MFLLKMRIFRVLEFAALSLIAYGLLFRAVAQVPAAAPQTSAAQTPPEPYDRAIFQKTIPSDQLRFLSQFAGQPSYDLFRDKQFRKLMKNFVPDCTYHYGSDMSLEDSIEKVFTKSDDPVLVRDGRYVLLSGEKGPYLGGRGFLWIDMQEGIGLGGFYFHPTNGEPTPSLTVFSRQIREKIVTLSQLPPAFENDMIQWATAVRVPPITTRYFIGGLNKRILLQHDEDYCRPAVGYPPPPQDVCERMTADAADVDVTAAYYLDQIHNATNGTAWMIGQDQLAWIQMRDDTCRVGPDPLRCRIRVSRERTSVIIHRGPAGPVTHPPHR